MKKYLPTAIIFASFILSGTLVSYGAETLSGNISLGINAKNIKFSFPIAELGNCGSKTECKSFCGKEENIVACTNFAEKNGLISKEKAERAREFADVLRGEGPGGCGDEVSCEAYCENTEHIAECVSFVEKHKLLSTEELREAKQIQKALSSGATMPGSCKNKTECEKYCSLSDHTEECLSFAEKASLMTEEEIKEARQVLPLLQKGETPGGCKTRQSCRAYCEDGSHFNECIAFAEKAGFMNAEELAIAKKVGGIGPGGCKSKEACETYCNKEENAKVCFNFAKDKGILSAVEIKEIEEGMARLRTGLENMPKEMSECIKRELGPETMAKIESGELVPSRGIGEKVKACVSQNISKLKETARAALEIATPEVLACLESKVGKENVNKFTNGETIPVELAEKFRGCFSAMRAEGLKKAQEGLSKMPGEMRSCLESKLGAGEIAKIQGGDEEALSPQSASAFKECAENFKQKAVGELNANLNRIPETARQCVESKLGSGYEDKIASGEIAPERIQNIITTCMKDVIMNTQGAGSAPSGAGAPSVGGAPPLGQMPEPTPEICARFSMAPSCDFVPEGPARELCRKCK